MKDDLWRTQKASILQEEHYQLINDHITSVIVFTGTMNTTLYTDILDAALIPFLEAHFPYGHALLPTRQ